MKNINSIKINVLFFSILTLKISMHLSSNKEYATNILEKLKRNWNPEEFCIDRAVEIREIHVIHWTKISCWFAIQFAPIVNSYEILIASDSDWFLRTPNCTHICYK